MDACQLSPKVVITFAAVLALVGLLLALLATLLDPPGVAVFPTKADHPPKLCITKLHIYGSELYVKSNCLQYYEIYVDGRPVRPCPVCVEVGHIVVQLNGTAVVIEIRGPHNATLYAVRKPGGRYEFVDRQTGRAHGGYIIVHRAGQAG